MICGWDGMEWGRRDGFGKVSVAGRKLFLDLGLSQRGRGLA